MILSRLCSPSRYSTWRSEKRLNRFVQPLLGSRPCHGQSIGLASHAQFLTTALSPTQEQTPIDDTATTIDLCTLLFTSIHENHQFLGVLVRAHLSELPKNFDPVTYEETIYRWWEENGFFEPSGLSDDCFVISMPPPNVTGRLHMGHAMFVTLQDIMIRFARMRGKNVLWVPGTDHAGIATQMVVEKMLNAGGISRMELGRDKFEERVWQWKAEYGGFITEQLRRLGASCDWSRERFTLDQQLSVAVNEAFVRLYEKGLIYKGSYLVNWSPSLQTAVSDLEVEYSEEQGTLYIFKYPLADGDGYIPVATTRPETILGDTAVAVHPNDDRYQHLIGQRCRVPTTNRCIKIIADEYVDMKFGTGALKITPGHDPNDYEIGQRLNLDIINILNKDGTLNSNAGVNYAGMDRFDVRKTLWADLEREGLALKTEKYTIRVPRSQRGGEIIEPLISEQWFVRMETLAKPALDAVHSGDVRIMPSHFEQIFNNWLENIKDWCISRQLWWGHRIPVWYIKSDTATDSSRDDYIVARSYEDALSEAQRRYGSNVELMQETDVLDTWFSSGLWPFSTLGWPDLAKPDYQKFYPTQVLETGYDILFFWVARMIMMGLEFTGKVPFSTVLLHGLVRDEKGRKMSKSLGNVIDPLDLVSQYGADPLRYTMVTGITAGQDLNLNLEKFTTSRHFANKLWNIGKFIGMNLPNDPSALQELPNADFSSMKTIEDLAVVEKWIISRLHQLIDRVTTLQERFDLSEAGRELYEFIWFDFADWYVEAAKTRLSDQSDAYSKHQTQRVLVYCFDRVLKLIHPFMPFISERLWQALPHQGMSLIISPWPQTQAVIDTNSIAVFDAIQSIIKSVRNARAEYNVDQTRKIPGTIIILDNDLLQAIKSEAAVIALLAKMKEEETDFASALTSTRHSSEQHITLVVKNGIEVVLPMSGLFDSAKEVERLQKQRAKIEKEYDNLETRLQNANFVEKAPVNIVDDVRSKRDAAKAQLVQIAEKLARLE